MASIQKGNSLILFLFIIGLSFCYGDDDEVAFGSGCKYGKKLGQIIAEQVEMNGKLDRQKDALVQLTEMVNSLIGHGGNTNVTVAPVTDDFSSCADIYNTGVTLSRVYTINVAGKNIQVFCDMGDGGGWTVFQRRMDGSINFFRNWNDYRDGFGNVAEEHWLGNDILAAMTAEGRYTLRVEAKSFADVSGSYDYTNFKVDNEENKYKLTIDSVSDGNGLSVNNGQFFTTIDKDNDNFGSNCASDEHYKGGWWYSDSCGYTNLNGPYSQVREWVNGDHIFWYPLDRFYSIPFSQMKFRPT